MLRIASIGTVLILAAATYSTSAEAQRGRGPGGGPGAAGMSRGIAPGIGRGVAPGVGRVVGPGTRVAPLGPRVARGAWTGRYPRYAYRYGDRYRYGYWPYLGWGLAVGALAAWPYYDGYDYGYYDGYGYGDAGVAYCMRRFRSYDPVSRTYLGYDGRRHSCP